MNESLIIKNTRYQMRDAGYGIRYAIISLLFFIISVTASAQLLTPLSNDVIRKVEYFMTKESKTFFTVWKPYYDNQLTSKARQDSFALFSEISGSDNSWLKRKLFRESFVQVDSNRYYLFADPLFDFAVGKDNNNRKLLTNTRAFRAGGRLGKSFAFATEFYENQAIFNTALDGIFRRTKIIPGQGRGRVKNNTWDYAHSSGYVSFSPISQINIQLGHGKQFIGDGFRSLILSDVSYNYPYFRATYQYKNFMYSWMLASTQNLAIKIRLSSNEEPFIRESASIHLLSFNILKRLQLSVIKCALYNNPDTFGRFKANFNLFNPVMLPGNAGADVHSIWGINAKIVLHPRIWVYQQVVLDNLSGKESIRTGYQVGLKYFDMLGIKGLYFQSEYNRVAPYMYSSREKALPWSNFGEPLAHRYGNNFEEGVIRMAYNYKRWQFNSNTGYARQLGEQDATGRYFNGTEFFTNNKKLFLQNFLLSFYVNPKTFMNFSLGYYMRKEEIAGTSVNTNYIYFSFRTSLMNLYYDL